MQSFSLNNKFTFLETQTGTTLEQVSKIYDEFKPVCVPHDWLIYHNENYYLDSVGWYRLILNKSEYLALAALDISDKSEKLLYLSFDGVYMDTTIYVNGVEAYRWPYGYTAFGFYLDDYLKDGDNEILVRVNHQAPNSRWYSGAGIYRDVELLVCNKTHFEINGVYVSSKKNGEAYNTVVDARYVTAKEDESKSISLKYILSYEGEQVLESLSPEFEVKNPKEWNVYEGNLYELKVQLFVEDTLADEYTTTIGFREVVFDHENGLLINGIKTVINGVCMHHDLGCIGSAYNHDAALRQVMMLKRMGVNAIRFSHNPPARDFLDITDRMGFLVMDESFDMWRNEKTTYDYARFFEEWHEKDMESFVKRDRNHPCVIMWSIGNEIADTHWREDGLDTTKKLRDLVEKYDPDQNARVTLASNYLAWEPTQKCMEEIKLAGYNYGENLYAAHYNEHPDWIIYGSETGSVVSSRGVYHFPYKQLVLADDDEQCSSLGNSNTSWGAKSTEHCISEDRDFGHSLGMFVWTGFDYIGEPTPYHTKNSYFGQIDTAGFEKDAFYIYQSQWVSADEKPMIHIFPYWDFNNGQLIDFRVCTNLSEVEVFLNGVSQGRRKIKHRPGAEFVETYSIPYIDGSIEAFAYDEQGNVRASKKLGSFKDATALELTAFAPDKSEEKLYQELYKNQLDFIAITAMDEAGNEVANAMDYVEVLVENGKLLGLDNGDSTDTAPYQSNIKKLFNGKLLAVVKRDQADVTPTVNARIVKVVDGLQAVPVRNIKLNALSNRKLTSENSTVEVSYEILPKDATDKELTFVIVNDAGIPVNYAEITEIDKEHQTITIAAKKDGEFRLRAMSKAGTDKIRIISVLEFEVEGMGDSSLNPYEFVSAGLFSKTVGEIGIGNERGIASARGNQSAVIYESVDFGNNGARTIHLPIFTLGSDEYRVRIYDGEFGTDSAKLILDSTYQKEMIWNTYQEETYELERALRGTHTLSFVFEEKLHMKGFYFEELTRAFEVNYTAECDRVYGDSFTVTDTAIEQIGNNVTIEFENISFGQDSALQIEIEGRSTLPKNSIHMIVSSKDGVEERFAFEFEMAPDYEKRYFEHSKLSGNLDIKFVFLPGTQFDFKSFRFIKTEER